MSDPITEIDLAKHIAKHTVDRKVFDAAACIRLSAALASLKQEREDMKNVRIELQARVEDFMKGAAALAEIA